MGMGYVYILTNPSFREDWVKIGKTRRPVNVRSAEDAYQGPCYFSYNGENLDHLRTAKERARIH